LKVQGEAQLLNVPVADSGGRRLGRVVAVHCSPDPYTAAWLIVRLRGLRRQLRAVPARDSHCTPTGELMVPYRRADVYASPALSSAALAGTVRRAAVEAFYSPGPAT
jgi:hypothetical protein